MPKTIVEWIPAFEAMMKFERHLGGRSLAGDSLAEYIRDGTLRAKAGEMWVSEEPTVKKAWKNLEERRTAKRDVELKPLYFRTDKCWAVDKAEWRWAFNKFSVTLREDPPKRRMMADVTLNERDLISITGAKDPRSGGSPGKTEEWTAYWHAVVQFAVDQRLRPGKFKTQADLRREILSEINDSLSDKTITEHTRRIWQKFCQG